MTDDAIYTGTEAILNGKRSGGRFRQTAGKVTAAIDNANEASKRLEETANFVAVTLACVAVVSIVALGIAIVALIGVKGSDHSVKSADGGNE